VKNHQGGLGPLRTLVLGVLGSFVALVPAYAQEQADGDAADLSEVIVTGSRIRSVNVDSAVPVISVTAV
jgi:hypothetical protein